MARYFLDTNVLIGLTFRHDRWSAEAQRLLDTNNTIYTSEYNVYEYCSTGRGPRIPQDPEEMDVEFDAERGVFGAVLRAFSENVEQNIPMYNREIDLQRNEGLTVQKVIKTFFDNVDVRDQAKDHFRRYFQEYFSNHDLTPRNAKRCVEDLRDKVLQNAQVRKQDLLSELRIIESTFDDETQARLKIQLHIGVDEDGIPEDDLPWLLDVIALADQGKVSTVVTGDLDIVRNQEGLISLFDLSVLYLLDEFESDHIGESAAD
jgi:predicted nucleic acid-binding protein